MIIACYLKILGISDVDDEPAPGKIPQGILTGQSSSRRNFIRSLSVEVVENFIFQSQQSEERSARQKYADWLINSNHKTADGRYKCRHTGCTVTFHYDGRKRVEHEKSHGLHLEVEKLHVPVVDDEMLSYQLSLLELGMIVVNFFDAISEGDGARLIRQWKFMLPHLRNDGAASRKYALEGMYMLSQIEALLSPYEAHSLIWNRFNKAKESYGGNIPLDLAVEHYNNMMKNVVRLLGPNNTNRRAIDRYAKAVTTNKAVLSNFDKACRVLKRSGRHTQASIQNDLKKIVKELKNQEALTFKKNRHYKAHTKVQPSLLDNFDVHDFYAWIETHKKKLQLNRGQR